MTTENIIKDAFHEMIASISKTVTPTTIPHLYHAKATTHEINSVYHFAKAVEQRANPSVVYLEFQCDSGRVDAVIITRSAWLFVEAKSRLDHGRLGSLERQAARLQNPDDSLRHYLNERIPPFKKEVWNLEGQDEIWGVLLAETFETPWKDKWLSLPTTQTYTALSTYTCRAEQNQVYVHQPWWHLLAFRRVL